MSHELYKSSPKILNYSENNEILVGGVFSRTLYVYKFGLCTLTAAIAQLIAEHLRLKTNTENV